jgi:virginiamycin B lyase
LRASRGRARGGDENNAKQIGRIPADATVANPRITEYPAAPSESPIGIAAGPDRDLWFGGYGGYAVARMSTAGRVAASFTTTQRNTDNVTAGSDGAMWFVECAAPGSIGRITKAGQLSEAPVPVTLGKKPRPLSIASGSDGNIWFADIGNDAIGKVLVTGSGIGAIVEIRLPRAHGRLTPQAITAGPDGALWFTAATPAGAGFVGRIPVTATGSGDVILYPIPTKSTLFYGIASDGAGAVWFTEYDAGKLGRLTVGPGNDSAPNNR